MWYSAASRTPSPHVPTVFSKIVVYRWVGSPSRTSTARYFVSPPSANILLTAAEIVSGLTTEDSVAAATSSLMKKQPPGPSKPEDLHRLVESDESCWVLRVPRDFGCRDRKSVKSIPDAVVVRVLVKRIGLEPVGANPELLGVVESVLVGVGEGGMCRDRPRVGPEFLLGVSDSIVVRVPQNRRRRDLEVPKGAAHLQTQHSRQELVPVSVGITIRVPSRRTRADVEALSPVGEAVPVRVRIRRVRGIAIGRSELRAVPEPVVVHIPVERIRCHGPELGNSFDRQLDLQGIQLDGVGQQVVVRVQEDRGRSGVGLRSVRESISVRVRGARSEE